MNANDPNLTAFVLGELPESEMETWRALLEENPELRYEAEAIRATVEEIEAAMQAESLPTSEVTLISLARDSASSRPRGGRRSLGFRVLISAAVVFVGLLIALPFLPRPAEDGVPHAGARPHDVTAQQVAVSEDFDSESLPSTEPLLRERVGLGFESGSDRHFLYDLEDPRSGEAKIRGAGGLQKMDKDELSVSASTAAEVPAEAHGWGSAGSKDQDSSPRPLQSVISRSDSPFRGSPPQNQEDRKVRIEELADMNGGGTYSSPTSQVHVRGNNDEEISLRFRWKPERPVAREFEESAEVVEMESLPYPLPGASPAPFGDSGKDRIYQAFDGFEKNDKGMSAAENRESARSVLNAPGLPKNPGLRSETPAPEQRRPVSSVPRESVENTRSADDVVDKRRLLLSNAGQPSYGGTTDIEDAPAPLDNAFAVERQKEMRPASQPLLQKRASENLARRIAAPAPEALAESDTVPVVSLPATPPALEQPPLASSAFDLSGKPERAAQAGQGPLGFRPELSEPGVPGGPDFVVPKPGETSIFVPETGTAAYVRLRDAIRQGRLPSRDEVRLGEYLNNFCYGNVSPAVHGDSGGALLAPLAGKPAETVAPGPLAMRVEVAACPWKADHLLALLVLEAPEATGETGHAEPPPVARDLRVLVDFNPERVAAYRLVGYENQILRAGNFRAAGLRNTTVAGGTLRAGDRACAIYEILPEPQVNPGSTAELMVVRLRGLEHGSDRLLELDTPVVDSRKMPGNRVAEISSDAKFKDGVDRGSDDFRFASAVALFGMLLRDEQRPGDADWDRAETLARESVGENPDRKEFLELLRAARTLAAQSETSRTSP